MAAHRAVLGLDADSYRAELHRQFNGYRFWKRTGENVYNPVSINWNLAKPQPEFLHCWTTTGRPSMLMNFYRIYASVMPRPTRRRASPSG